MQKCLERLTSDIHVASLGERRVLLLSCSLSFDASRCFPSLSWVVEFVDVQARGYFLCVSNPMLWVSVRLLFFVCRCSAFVVHPLRAQKRGDNPHSAVDSIPKHVRFGEAELASARVKEEGGGTKKSLEVNAERGMEQHSRSRLLGRVLRFFVVVRHEASMFENVFF